MNIVRIVCARDPTYLRLLIVRPPTAAVIHVQSVGMSACQLLFASRLPCAARGRGLQLLVAADDNNNWTFPLCKLLLVSSAKRRDG
jgi:hypothetical protein